jgi:hypothetical protein
MNDNKKNVWRSNVPELSRNMYDPSIAIKNHANNTVNKVNLFSKTDTNMDEPTRKQILRSYNTHTVIGGRPDKTYSKNKVIITPMSLDDSSSAASAGIVV